MQVQINLTGTDAQGRVFLTWSPVKASARLVNGPPAGSVAVTLRSAGTGGGLVFDTVRSDRGTGSLNLSLPADGRAVSFWGAGEFLKPSVAYGDAVVQAVGTTDGAVLGSKDVMVRIRKKTQALTAPERDRYLNAIGTLNARGTGAYRDFRDMHVNNTTREMHGNVGFLPWHRAYLLDLERSLQAIDPTVALPYWRFDEPAPDLFTRDFMGEPDASGQAVFKPGHALEHWVTDGLPGIVRGPDFPPNSPAAVLSEIDTINLGFDYADFIAMEIDPHGSAHVSFFGPISSIGTAVRDPLFFMLHANVDRLWAKWQWVRHHQTAADALAFAPASPNTVGHRLGDTMWPWNGITTRPRLSTAPGGPFPPSLSTPLPGRTPKVEDMLDYLAVGAADGLGFAYDDVPFELPPTVVAGGP